MRSHSSFAAPAFALEQGGEGPLTSPLPDDRARQRAHTERMLARAERRSKQAAKLVEKWKTRLTELDREGVAAKQARLWSDDHSEQ
jgi:hypothetical protein